MGIRSITTIVLRSLLAALVMAILLSSSSAGVVMARPAFNLVTVDDHPPQTGLSYPGSGWVHWTGTTNAINNTVSSSSVAGDSVSYTFTGSTITWLYSMAANRGTQTISIDSEVKDAAFNSYAPQTRRQIGKTWNVYPGTHTIIVKNNTNGLVTDVDAFASDIATVGSGVYDDSNAQLRSIGNWSQHTGSGAYQGTLHSSNVTGEGFRFTFLGDNITYVYSTAANRGYAMVTIDGVAQPDLNLYSATTIRL